MGVLVMVGSVLAVIGFYLLVLPPATSTARDAAAARIAAAAMAVRQKAAVDWCLRGACADGPIPTSQLLLPPGFDPPWLVSSAQNGRVTTRIQGLAVDRLAVGAALQDLGGRGAGLVGVAGTIVERRGTGTPAVPGLPVAGAPAGTAVMSQQVR
jgi:hypothetical protein